MPNTFQSSEGHRLHALVLGPRPRRHPQVARPAVVARLPVPRVNPLKYRDRPEVRIAAYAVVGSHILLCVRREKGTGTCAFDVEAEKWEMVCDENLPFTGEAVHLGAQRFVARDKDGAAVVYHIEMGVVDTASTTTGGARKTMELTIFEFPVVPNKGIVREQLVCAMGDGRFPSFDIRYDDPGPEAMLEKARIVHRTYSQVQRHEAGKNSVVIAKEERRIYKLRDPLGHLARSSPVVAAFTM